MDALHNDLNENGKASALAAFFLPVTFTIVVKVGPEYEGQSRLPPLCFIVTPYAAYAAHSGSQNSLNHFFQAVLVILRELAHGFNYPVLFDGRKKRKAWLSQRLASLEGGLHRFAVVGESGW